MATKKTVSKKSVQSSSVSKAKLPTGNTWSLDRIYPWLLVLGGFIGLLMSFIITVEKIHLLKDPTFVPECSINPIISCGNIMKSPEASVFGFPNPLIGLMGFSVVVTIGMAMFAGAKFKSWFWKGLNIASALAAVFCMWLFHEAVYEIGSLCIYCIVVWTVTLPIFIYTTVWNMRNGHLVLKDWLKKIGDFVDKHHGDILFVWYVIIFFGILTHFWYYWKTLI